MGSIRFSLLCIVTVSVLFSLNFDAYEAAQFVVGGKENSWSIPTSAGALNAWAENERFKIGDSLVFKYDSKTDSVLRVQEGDYKKCIKTKPINEYHDGNTAITINESGSFFFISGADGHCEKGEKLEVKVLSHKHSSPPLSLPPKGSPATVTAPVVSPAAVTPPALSPVAVTPPVLSPAVVTPAVLSPAESPKSSTSAGSNLRIIDASTIVVATLVGIAMV